MRRRRRVSRRKEQWWFISISPWPTVATPLPIFLPFALGKCLSPYHPHALIQTSPLPGGLNGKALSGKYEKLFGHSVWGAEFKEGGVTPSEGDRRRLCRRADQRQKTAHPLGLVATKTLNAALSCYSQSHIRFSSVTHTCGFQHFLHGKDICNELKQRPCFP